MTRVRLVAALCAAEVFSMAGFASFAALLPQFVAQWRLSGIEAGWITGIYYAGYVAGVPLLTSLTDRVDARRVYLASAALTGAAMLAFALFADGFWSALACQAAAGFGLAGTYMPGLKALSDRIGGPTQPRAVAFYTACFGLGASLSYLLAGEIAFWFGWRWVFAAAASGSALAIAIAMLALRPAAATSAAAPARLLDFRPVMRDRTVLGYCLAYAAHNWELFGLRAWIVAFLVFSQGLQPAGAWRPSPTVLATLLTLLGVVASIAGNEVATRHDRRRWIAAVMVVSAAVAGSVGFLAPLPFVAVLALCLVHALTVNGDSGSLTAGVVGAAPPALRGTAMALYSMIGFAGAFLGPLAFGAVLDAVGAGRVLGWGLAFATLGLGVLMGPLALRLCAGRVMPPAAGGSAGR